MMAFAVVGRRGLGHVPDADRVRRRQGSRGSCTEDRRDERLDESVALNDEEGGGEQIKGKR